MPPRLTKMTDRVAATLECPAGKKNHLYPDPAGNGLCLVVQVTGRRYWKFRFDYAGRRNDIITLGEFPLMGLDEARARAAEYQRAVKIDKRDPRTMVFNPRTATTLADVLDAYIERTSDKAKATVTSGFKPIRAKFGAVTMRDLDRVAVKNWMNVEYAPRDGKPNRGGAARTMLRYLEAAIRSAMKADSGLGLPEGFEYPFWRLNREIIPIQNHVKTSYATNWEDDQFEAIMKAIRTGYTSPAVKPLGVMVIELCLLTGARPSEIESLKWDEVHPVPGQPGMRLIIKDKSKTYARTGRPRQITLGGRGVAVLDRARLYHGQHSLQSEYVFPTMRDQANTRTPHFNSTNQVARTLSKWAGFEVRPYQFRSAYINHSLEAAETGSMATFHATLAVVAENVGHTSTMMTQTHYVRAKASKTAQVIETTDRAFDRFDQAA